MVSGYHEGKSSEEEAIYGLQYYLSLYDARSHDKNRQTTDELIKVMLPFILELNIRDGGEQHSRTEYDTIISLNEIVAHIIVDLPIFQDMSYLPLIHDVFRGIYGIRIKDNVINDMRLKMPSKEDKEPDQQPDKAILRSILVDLQASMESLTSEQGLIDPLELVISITEYVGENPLIVSLLDRYFRVVGTSINESGVSSDKFNARLFDYYFYDRISQEPYASALRRFFGDELYVFLVQEKGTGRMSNYDFGLFAELVAAQAQAKNLNLERYFVWMGAENWKMIYFLLWEID